MNVEHSKPLMKKVGKICAGNVDPPHAEGCRTRATKTKGFARIAPPWAAQLIFVPKLDGASMSRAQKTVLAQLRPSACVSSASMGYDNNLSSLGWPVPAHSPTCPQSQAIPMDPSKVLQA